ncbi:MAG: hypothetical protein ACLVHS_09585 [Blautia wexlerae]
MRSESVDKRRQDPGSGGKGFRIMLTAVNSKAGITERITYRGLGKGEKRTLANEKEIISFITGSSMALMNVAPAYGADDFY